MFFLTFDVTFLSDSVLKKSTVVVACTETLPVGSHITRVCVVVKKRAKVLSSDQRRVSLIKPKQTGKQTKIINKYSYRCLLIFPFYGMYLIQLWLIAADKSYSDSENVTIIGQKASNVLMRRGVCNHCRHVKGTKQHDVPGMSRASGETAALV